jgi:hypothetical protein
MMMATDQAEIVTLTHAPLAQCPRTSRFDGLNWHSDTLRHGRPDVDVLFVGLQRNRQSV